MTRSLMAIDPEKLAQPVVLGEIEHVLAGTLKQSTVRWMGKSLQARSWRTAGVADRLSPRRRHWAAMTISEVTCGNDCRNLCINGSLLEVMNRVKRDRQQSLQNCRSSGKDGSRLTAEAHQGRLSGVAALGISATSPHWMRHTHASHALHRGADLTTIRDNVLHELTCSLIAVPPEWK